MQGVQYPEKLSSQGVGSLAWPKGDDPSWDRERGSMQQGVVTSGGEKSREPRGEAGGTLQTSKRPKSRCPERQEKSQERVLSWT